MPDDDAPKWFRDWDELQPFLKGEGIIPAKNPDEQEPRADEKSGARESGEDQSIPDALAAINRTLADQGDADRREERREDVGNKWLQGLTLAFVIATTVGIFWQASIFNSQLNEMKGASIQTKQLIENNAKLAIAATQQAEAAAEQARATDKEASALADSAQVSRDNLIASARAWVGPNNAAFVAEPSVGKPIEITTTYQNTGRQPALNFIYFAEPFAMTLAEDADGTLARKVGQYLDACKANKEWSGGSVIYPSTGFSSYTLNAKTKDDFVDDAITKGDKIIVFQGCFLYRTFDAPRHSYFCYFYRQGQSKFQNLNICPGGHYAD